jgi:RimJ/RimL family protein N-acetyltransferase
VDSVRLEPFSRPHLPGFAALAGDPEVVRFTRFPPEAPPDFPETFLRRYEAGRAEGTREAFAIVADGAFLGIAVAPVIDRTARTAELGYGVAAAARGRGVATEALRQLTDWAFAQGLLRLELLIGAGNAGSLRVAERCGYVREGVLRSKWFKGDLREDTELWSKLPTDP